MNIINLSERKFESLNPLDFGSGVINTEADLYELYYKGKKRVFKKLHLLNGAVFANKLYTLEMLDDNKEYLPENFVIPNFLAVVNGKIVGCAEEYIEGINLEKILNNISIEPKTQLEYLKKIGELLEQLKYIRQDTPLKSIFINDLHAGNFVVTKDSLKVIDLDSCKICDNKPFPSRYLLPNTLLKNSNKYLIFEENFKNYKGNAYVKDLGYIDANEESDLYCYIITILNYLYKGNVHRMEIDGFYKYLNYLEYIGINYDLISMFERIILNCSNKNPKEYLETLTTSQIGRANNKVFKKVIGG
ncbi:MAG: hypothetical protein IK997_04155 [Bacilli bacterium]|nr:hypothetical protein [Bacilli bacterium]